SRDWSSDVCSSDLDLGQGASPAGRDSSRLRPGELRPAPVMSVAQTGGDAPGTPEVEVGKLAELVPEPASFRDPDNQVGYDAHGQVLRVLRGAAVEDWRALAGATFFADLVADGRICRTEPVDPDPDAAGELTLRHERIPFISYP